MLEVRTSAGHGAWPLPESGLHRTPRMWAGGCRDLVPGRVVGSSVDDMQRPAVARAGPLGDAETVGPVVTPPDQGCGDLDPVELLGRDARHAGTAEQTPRLASLAPDEPCAGRPGAITWCVRTGSAP